MDKYKIGRKAVWGRCDRLGIPKVYEGRNTFYSKSLLTQISLSFLMSSTLITITH